MQPWSFLSGWRPATFSANRQCSTRETQATGGSQATANSPSLNLSVQLQWSHGCYLQCLQVESSDNSFGHSFPLPAHQQGERHWYATQWNCSTSTFVSADYQLNAYNKVNVPARPANKASGAMETDEEGIWQPVGFGKDPRASLIVNMWATIWGPSAGSGFCAVVPRILQQQLSVIMFHIWFPARNHWFWPESSFSL